MSMCEYELEVLRSIVLGYPRPWGAAVGAAMEYLKSSGYIDEHGRPTDKGRYIVKEVRR
jgi:hypothetical protein